MFIAVVGQKTGKQQKKTKQFLCRVNISSGQQNKNAAKRASLHESRHTSMLHHPNRRLNLEHCHDYFQNNNVNH